jgi:hypothetical protein
MRHNRVRHLVMAILLPCSAWAAKNTGSGVLYKCVSDNGVPLYTNQRVSGSQCKTLEREYPISTFSSPKASAGTRPADFPKVGEDQQKARDNDRKAILKQELAAEQRMLDEAQKTLTEQQSTVNANERNVGGGVNQAKVQDRLKEHEDNVALHQRNVEALQKELNR